MKTIWNRRDFLKTASAATLSALAAGYPRALHADEPQEKITPTADTLIVLWLAGGMAHTETFDPKRYSPFERGMKPAEMFSTKGEYRLGTDVPVCPLPPASERTISVL